MRELPGDDETAAEISGDVSALLIEALVSLLRQQDSDLRMLALVEAHAEDADARTERIVHELASHHPEADEASLRALVAELSDMYFERIARAEALEQIVEAVFDSAQTLSEELAPNSDGAALAGRLIAACADVPDSTRMYSTLLMGSIAAFDGTLLTVLRLLASADPAAALSKGRKRGGFNGPLARLRDDDELYEAIDLVTRRARGGWKGWQELFGWFGVVLQDQPPLLGVAARMRNAIAHTNGYVADVPLELSADDPMVLVNSADLTPAFLRSVYDAHVHAAVALSVRIIDSSFPDAAHSGGSLLGKVSYELLVRKRDETVAHLIDLHDEVRFEDEGEERNLQVNEWLALKNLGRQGEYMRDLSHWGTAVAGSIHEVARSVLLSRPNEARRKAWRLRQEGLLGEREWQTWPLFGRVRES